MRYSTTKRTSFFDSFIIVYKIWIHHQNITDQAAVETVGFTKRIGADEVGL